MDNSQGSIFEVQSLLEKSLGGLQAEMESQSSEHQKTLLLLPRMAATGSTRKQNLSLCFPQSLHQIFSKSPQQLDQWVFKGSFCAIQLATRVV